MDEQPTYMQPDEVGTLKAKVAYLESTNRMLNWHIWEYKRVKDQCDRQAHEIAWQEETITQQKQLIALLSDIIKELKSSK
jgi:hypothetical protein